MMHSSAREAAREKAREDRLQRGAAQLEDTHDEGVGKRKRERKVHEASLTHALSSAARTV